MIQKFAFRSLVGMKFNFPECIGVCKEVGVKNPKLLCMSMKKKIERHMPLVRTHGIIPSPKHARIFIWIGSSNSRKGTRLSSKTFMIHQSMPTATMLF